MKTFNLLASALIATFFVSCSSKSNIPVPEDAAFVLHINGASMSEKLPWEEIKQSELFKTALEETEDSLAIKIMNNPEESGININGDSYLFAKTQGRGGYIALVTNLKDVTKLESFVGQINTDKKIETKNGISFIANNDNVITWNKERLILIGNASDLNGNMGKGGNYDSRSSFSADSLIHFAKEIYELKKSKSIGNDSKFSSLIKEKGDLHVWINAGSLFSKSVPAILAITKINLLFKGNISTATVNFDAGKITYKAKNYFSKELSDLYKKHSLKNFDEVILQKIPAGNVDALLAFNYPPEGLKDFFSLLGVDGLLNLALSQAGFSVDDFVKANKGELLLSVSDFKIEKKEIKQSIGKGEEFSFNTEIPSAKILFATSINEKTAFEKMIGVLTETVAKEGADANEMLSKIPYTLTDNWFVAGNDSLTINSFGKTTTNHDFINKIKGHPIAGYMNIKNFINGAKNSLAKDSVGTAISDRSLQIWSDIIFYGGEFKNGGVESYAEINMVDAKTNSLKQLNGYLGFFAKLMREQEKRRKEEYSNWDDAEPLEFPSTN